MMLNIFINIQNVFTSSAKRRCTGCKRRLDKAIDEQIERGCSCDTNNCVFIKEITDAIVLANHSKEPELLKWESNIDKVLKGKKVTLKWDVKYAKKVFISGVGEVPIVGEKSVVIDESIRFTLQIIDFQNQEYIVEDIVDIVALEAPFLSLTNESLKIEENNQAEITWQSRYVTKVIFIDKNQQVDVTNLELILVNPTETSNYSLEFHALDNITVITKNILVEVHKKPKINFFKIEPDFVLLNKPVYLEWQTEFSKKVEINFGVGEVATSGNKRLYFAENTRLFLRVFGELSVIEEVIDIFVFPQPLDKSLFVPIPEMNLDLILSSYNLDFVEVDFSVPKISFKDPNYLFEEINSPFNLNSTPKMIELEVPESLIKKSSKKGNSIIDIIFRK
jgi:hypothetical protein